MIRKLTSHWHHLGRDRKWAIGLSLIVHLFFALMLAVWSWTIPMPPPPEQGVLINFGDSPEGQGTEEPGPQMLEKQIETQPTENQKAATTQDFEDAPVIKKVISSPEPVRQVNQRALFGKRASTSAAEGTGNTSGNQGSKDGVANAPHGSGSGIGSGGNFRLQGRSIVGSLPKPQYTVNNAGTVIVEIIVDRSGNVIKANALVQGSTVQDDALFKAAEKAALRAKFSSSDAAEIQRGTITYHFRMQD